jgi:ATP-dependent DNA helicase DinG
VGRLIRSSTDRGVVAILDGRVLTKPYGKQFLAALPQAPRVATPEEAARFIDG